MIFAEPFLEREMPRTGQLVSWLGILFLICGEVRGLGDAVVYAVNCGGEAHTDILGVKYQRDDNKHGTPSEFGKQLLIGKWRWWRWWWRWWW